MKAIDKPGCRERGCSPDCPGTQSSLPAFIKPLLYDIQIGPLKLEQVFKM
jgi:hypothetical protein